MEAERRIEHERTIMDPNVEILAVRWNPDDSHIASACSDGTVKIYSSVSGSFIRTLNCRVGTGPVPITGIRWRPSASFGKTKNILIALTVEGTIMHWHATSGKTLNTIKLDCQTLSLDYDYEGRRFAVGCSDLNIRIYDESTKDVICNLVPGMGELLGHVNRIHSVKFLSDNMIVSGGWDNNILLWDIRIGAVARGMYGPQIAGDSIDSTSNLILTGGYQISDQLQLWRVDDASLAYSETLRSNDRACMVYSAQFSKHDCGGLFAIGGAGCDEAYFYETATKRRFAVLNNLVKPIYSIDFANYSNRVAVGSGDGSLRMLSVLEPTVIDQEI